MVTAVDSECTISAFEKSGGVLAPYFASRISEASGNLADLAESTTVEPVMHVPGSLNPADIPTRANSKPEDVCQASIWQSGPNFLSLARSEWPLSREFLDLVPQSELRSSKAIFNSVGTEAWRCALGPKLEKLVRQVMERSNCLSKVTNVVARILKCLFSTDREKIKESLSVRDIEAAARALFIASMGPTIAAMEAGKLESLRPIIRGGIVYARSRCDKSLLTLLGVDSLPILTRDSDLPSLIMWEAHNKNHRASPTDNLARSRQRAWIIRGRYLAKEVCASCPRCRILRCKLSQQLMADVPEHQLRPCPPFSYVSIDLAGPFKAKAMGNSRTFIKSWGLVVVCQNMRAVKMYATAGYSTDDFLTAFHRFMSNHGNPLLVVSDSGSQLRKAGQILAPGDPANLDWEKIKQGAARIGTDWKCVEAGCQWRNGLAESAVKLVKSTLGLTLASQATLNYAELDTLFARVANIVNWRPIAIRSFTEEDMHAITPNDLLLVRTRNRVPGPNYGGNDSLTRRQDVIDEMEQTWWQMWIVQALPNLVPYRRWKTEHRSLRVDDIVLVLYDRKLGAGVYRLGRILRTCPDAHGRVRTVVVGMRKRIRDKGADYAPAKLEEHTLGIQRIAVICPVEEQTLVDETRGSKTTQETQHAEDDIAGDQLAQVTE